MRPQSITSTRQFFLDLVARHEPECFFKGSTREDFEKWQERFRERFSSCVGPLPERVPLKIERLWVVEEGGLRKEKILLYTAPDTWVPAIVLRPLDRDVKGSLVAIHGHGRWGKDPVAGVDYPESRDDEVYYNYRYGAELAEAGFLVICPDLRPFGERGDRMPGEHPLENRDPCNVHALKGWLLGFNLMAYNLWDLMRCVDYLIESEHAVAGRIGAIGLSGGGAAAMHFGAMDSRLSATAVICALNSYKAWAVENDNFCGTQFLPGMFQFGDHAEICGLIAPRHLLVQIGGFDYGFPVAASMEALERLKKIYGAAGVSQRLVSTLGFGGHKYYGGAESFFTGAFDDSAA
jgi:dienelactone hydrolase